MSIFTYDDYRQFIVDQFSNRQSRNSSYSLRAFARDLNISASFLSEVLNGKKTLSYECCFRIGGGLRLDGFETEYLFAIVQLDHVKIPEARDPIKMRIRLLQQARNQNVAF